MKYVLIIIVSFIAVQNLGSSGLLGGHARSTHRSDFYPGNSFGHDHFHQIATYVADLRTIMEFYLGGHVGAKASHVTRKIAKSGKTHTVEI